MDVGRWMPIVISVAALSLAVYQGWETRSHNRLSVKPSVVAHSAFHPYDPSNAGVTLINAGLGPAVISDFQLFLKGQSVDFHAKSPTLVMQDILFQLGLGGKIWLLFDAVITPHILGRGERIEFLSISPQYANEDTVLELSRKIKPLGMALCYCSMYGDNCNTVQWGAQEIEVQCPD